MRRAVEAELPRRGFGAEAAEFDLEDAAGLQQQGLERVLGTPALFSTAYGNVGSSIYYALGVTAAIALGLTPLVFLISGLIFACTAATYAEGTVRYPEAGGSSSFARHAFNELVSFGAAWAQMLNYVITVAISAFFVPHYLSIFWDPLRTNPWDVVVGSCVVLLLVAINIVGIQEAAALNVLLAVVDFATQLLLVVLGFVLIFSPQTLSDNIHWGVAPTWTNFILAIPIGMLAYTGIETVSNMSEEAKDEAHTIPAAIARVRLAVFAIYFTLPAVALSALPVTLKDGEYQTLLGVPEEQGGYAGDPVLGVVRHHSSAEGPVARWRLPGLLLLALGFYFLLPFDIRGYIYYLNTRYAQLAAVLAVASLPLTQPTLRRPLLWASAACALLLALVLGRGFRAFSHEASEWDALAESTAPKPRVMGLIFDTGSRVVRHPVFLHGAAELARARGGSTNFSFALTPHSPLRYRSTPPPTFPSEWRPQDFDYASQGPAYDHFLVRGIHPSRIFGERLQRELAVAAESGNSWLVRRR